MHSISRRTFAIKAMAGLFAPSIVRTSAYSASAEKNIRFPKGNVSDDVLMGIKIPHLVGTTYRLRPETAQSFDRMVRAARKDGLIISVVSSFRSFESQKSIWNAKYRRYQSEGLEPEAIIDKIIEYSSLAGTSRHHWGTDLDIVEGSQPLPEDPLMTEYFLEGGLYRKLYLWLKENASAYHFYEPYTNDPRRTGFAYEPWHWSFAELSVPFLAQYQKIDLPQKYGKLSLEGRSYLTPTFLARYYKEWIMGINPQLIP